MFNTAILDVAIGIVFIYLLLSLLCTLALMDVSFYVLNKIIVIRATVKPKEKSQEDKSKD